MSEAFIGSYRILSRIAEASMSVVDKAADTRPNAARPIVAIKSLTERMREDAWKTACLRREWRHGRRMSHPNVIRFLDFFSDALGDHLVMEHVDGESLRDALDRKRLSPSEKLEIAKGVCLALQHVHERDPILGLVHADLKPENILLRRRGGPVERDDVVLIDFGTVVTHESDGSLFGAVKKGWWALFGGKRIVGGSTVYMSPEQARADFVDQRSDLYSLGILLYELFTGRPPFLTRDAEMLLAQGRSLHDFAEHAGIHGEYTQELVMKHQAERPVPPRERAGEIPLHLNAVILKCIEKKAADRFQTALEVLIELTQIRATPDGSLDSQRLVVPK